MKKALMIFVFLVIGFFGYVWLNKGNTWLGLIVIAASIYMIRSVLITLKHKGRLVFYNPHSTKNKLLIGRAVQMFESLNIMLHTKNHKTLDSRIKFIKNVYDIFVARKDDDSHVQNIEYALALYKQKYPDKTVLENQLQLLLNADFNILDKYLADCVVLSFGEFIKKEVLEMDKLKRESAKQKRVSKILSAQSEYEAIFDYWKISTDGTHIKAVHDMAHPFWQM